MFWIVLSLVLDQITKYWATIYLTGGAFKRVFGFFYLTYATNRGVSFGLLAGVKEVVIYLTLLTIVLLSVVPVLFKLSKFNEVMIGFIVGGALGNLVDRIRYGYVVDFLTFPYWPTIINVADIFIFIGSIGIMLKLITAELQMNDNSRKDKSFSKHGERYGSKEYGEHGYTGNEQRRWLATRQVRNGKDSRLDLKNVYPESDKEWRGTGQWNFEETELQGEVWGYNYLDSSRETTDSGHSAGEYSS